MRLVIIFISVALISISTLFVVQNLQKERNQKESAASTEKLKEKTQKDYEKLILEQENRKKETIEPIVSRVKPARGKNQINIVLVYPQNTSLDSISDLANELKKSNIGVFQSCTTGTSCYSSVSLKFLNTYYVDEATKFDISDFVLNTNVYGPFSSPDLPNIGDFANVWGKDPFATTILEDKFEKIAKQENITTKADDLMVFLYFDNSNLSGANLDENRFYDSKKFRSFADPEKRRAYVDIYSLNPKFSMKAVEITAHEVLHLFGATDKYIENPESKRVCSDKGLADTKKLWSNQTEAEIMCGYIDHKDGSITAGSFGKGTLTINELTAEEIGWTN